MLVITASPHVCSDVKCICAECCYNIVLHLNKGLIFLFPFCHLPSRDLDCLGVKNRALVTLPVDEVLQTLNDLITYFQLPDAELEHEERQIKLRSLKNRQNLFKQEVSFTVQEMMANKQFIKQLVPINTNTKWFLVQQNIKILKLF